MPTFLVRVQLTAAEPIDYTELHDQMESIGLKRQIQSTDGTWFDLPNAEYHGVNLPYDIERLRDFVMNIIAITNPPGGRVIVTQTQGSAWYLAISK